MSPCRGKISERMLPDQLLLVSIGIKKGRQSLLLSTPVFVAGDTNLVVTQVMKIDEK